MADQEFPSHLAGFVVSAFAAGYGASSLKHYVTGRMTPSQKAEEESDVLPLASSRKRNAEADITLLPPTKKGRTDLVDWSFFTNGSNTSLCLDAPPPLILVNTPSISEQRIESRTSGVIDPLLMHYAQTGSPAGEGHSVRELEDQVEGGGPRAALTCWDEMAVMSAGLPTVENKRSEEYQDSDRTQVGDDFEVYSDGAVESEDQNGEEEQSEEQNAENDNTNNLSEAHDSEHHNKGDDDLPDRNEEQHDSQGHDEGDEDDDESEGRRKEYGVISGKATTIDLSRQNELVDMDILILNAGAVAGRQS